MGLGTLLGKILGGGGNDQPATEAAEPVVYKGFTVVAAPIKEGGQYRTAGSISRIIDDEEQTARFIRADNHSDLKSATDHSERKARQIVDEQGDSLFDRANI